MSDPEALRRRALEMLSRGRRDGQARVHPRAALAAVHPELARRVGRVLDRMATLGHPMAVVCGRRTAPEQAVLHAIGRTVAGPGACASAPLGRIVTLADGVEAVSQHQLGRAVDCAFLEDGRASWSERHPWDEYGRLGVEEGLVWGGAWTTLVDKGHVELPPDVA